MKSKNPRPSRKAYPNMQLPSNYIDISSISPPISPIIPSTPMRPTLVSEFYQNRILHPPALFNNNDDESKPSEYFDEELRYQIEYSLCESNQEPIVSTELPLNIFEPFNALAIQSPRIIHDSASAKVALKSPDSENIFVSKPAEDHNDIISLPLSSTDSSSTDFTTSELTMPEFGLGDFHSGYFGNIKLDKLSEPHQNDNELISLTNSEQSKSQRLSYDTFTCNERTHRRSSKFNSGQVSDLKKSLRPKTNKYDQRCFADESKRQKRFMKAKVKTDQSKIEISDQIAESMHVDESMTKRGDIFNPDQVHMKQMQTEAPQSFAHLIANVTRNHQTNLFHCPYPNCTNRRGLSTKYNFKVHYMKHFRPFIYKCSSGGKSFPKNIDCIRRSQKCSRHIKSSSKNHDMIGRKSRGRSTTRSESVEYSEEEEDLTDFTDTSGGSE